MKKTAPQIALLPYFKMFIQASASGRRQTPAGKRITPGIIVNYQYACRLLQEFETKKAIVLRIQLLHRASLRTLQKEKKLLVEVLCEIFCFFCIRKKVTTTTTQEMSLR